MPISAFRRAHGDPSAPARPKRARRLGVVLIATATLLLGPLAPAHAAVNPYQNGPDPTGAELLGPTGPFSVRVQRVSPAAVSGFGGGVVYYPTGTGTRTFGVVAMMPGFLATASKWSWLGPRVASEGFVVIAVTPSGVFDTDSQRAGELAAALAWVTTASAAHAEADPGRLAVVGHSMGGGAAFQDGRQLPGLKAAVSLNPWDDLGDGFGDTVPTAVATSLGDHTSPAILAVPYYLAVPASTPKALLVFSVGDHNSAFSLNSLGTAAYTISWLKRFVDNDTRYDHVLCPGPGFNPFVAFYQATCPL